MINMQPHQPNRLVVPELDYPHVAGLSRYDTAMLKMFVVIVVEIAIEQARCVDIR